MTIFVVFLALFTSRRRTMKRFRRAIAWYGRVVTVLPFPFIRVYYEDHSKNDPPEPYIFVCNHRSTADPFLISLLPQEVIQVVNIWPFRIPVLGLYARLAGYLDINSMPPEVFFEKVLTLLREKVSVVFFPEGTRSVGRKMGNFHGSAFRLAKQAQVSIVPLCMSGSDIVFPRGSTFLRPGTIRVRRLSVILWNDYKDLNVFSLKNRVRDVISNELSLMENEI